MPKPRRGEVYWVNLDPVVGTEQGGRRPALIVQNDRGNENSQYTVIAAISSAPLRRVYPFTVTVTAGDANLPRDCYINCAQLRTIDQSRLESLIGQLPEAAMQQLADALRFELDI
jgi:mRNA interferase MazF